MRILFRVDAGIQMGSGHVARCLTLADALVQTGGTAEFICRDHDGDLTPWISQRGHRVQRLKTTQENRQAFQGDLAHSAWLGISQSEDAQQTLNAVSDDFFDWIVVDHYALDHRWHTRLREKSDHILAIDDLADRVHDADVLIDQNDRYVESNRYQDLVPSTCKKLLGPKYALLHPGFSVAREKMDAQDRHSFQQQHPQQGMVFLGGMDPDNVTCQILDALTKRSVCIPIHWHVIIGGSNPHRDAVRSACQILNKCPNTGVTLHVQVKEMAKLMSQIDFAVAAGGANTWERCCLGIPTATISIADNQVDVAIELDRDGIAHFIGRHDQLESKELSRALAAFIESEAGRSQMRNQSRLLVDGQGTSRVIQEMNSLDAEIARKNYFVA